MTGFIGVVLLVSVLLYAVAIRSPGAPRAHHAHPVGHHELASTAEDGRPDHGNLQNQATLSNDTRGGHVPSHFHTLDGEDQSWLYENRDNMAGGHSFVLLKPLEGAAPETNEFYAYHLSQYGPRHQHFVIVKMQVKVGNMAPLTFDTLYTRAAPANNFYSVSAAKGENPFRLIEILHGVNPRNRPAEERPGVPAGVGSYAVTMFDGLLVINNPDFNQHLLKLSGDRLVRERSQVTKALDGSRRAVLTDVMRFEHINDSPLSGAEYVAVKYAPAATRSYYLIHRLQGKNSYQHVTQVEFEQPVDLVNMTAYPVYNANLTPVPDAVGQELRPALSLLRNPSAKAEYGYAMQLAGATHRFRVVKDVLYLPMTPL